MAIPWQQWADEELNYLVDFGRKIVGDEITGTPNVIGTDGVVASAIALAPSPATKADRSAVTFYLTGGTPGALATIVCRARTEGGLIVEAQPQLQLLQ